MNEFEKMIEDINEKSILLLAKTRKLHQDIVQLEMELKEKLRMKHLEN